MKTIPHKTKRIHSLDSLRAIMMLLGLVIHSAVTYGVIDYGNVWPLKDPETTHLSNDFIANFIHSFRMPIFFLIAGFFGSLLFYDRKPLKMLKNRVLRIFFPFIIFLLVLNPLIIFSFSYTKLLFSGSDTALESTLSYFNNPLIFIPQQTFHLWFLYYLTLSTFAAVGLALIFNKLPIVSNYILQIFNWVIRKPVLRILVFASLTYIIYFFMGAFQVETSTSLIPNLNTFVFYFSFYIVGWILFRSKHILERLKRFDWIFTILGILLFSIHFFMNELFSFEMHTIANSLIVWLLIFGITGLFVRYGSNHSAKMRYISDSSYWFYLVHLPFTAIFPSLIVNWALPATIKFLFVLICTGTICLVSYQYLIRGTIVGEFLNGKKYSRKFTVIKKSEELPKFRKHKNSKQISW